MLFGLTDWAICDASVMGCARAHNQHVDRANRKRKIPIPTQLMCHRNLQPHHRHDVRAFEILRDLDQGRCPFVLSG